MGVLMKAEDSVQLCIQNDCNHLCHYSQAEISFKAGIREVVEWVEKYKSETTGYIHISFGQEWQAKLKEWGIE
jgi:hypothetical protein